MRLVFYGLKSIYNFQPETKWPQSQNTLKLVWLCHKPSYKLAQMAEFTQHGKPQNQTAEPNNESRLTAAVLEIRDESNCQINYDLVAHVWTLPSGYFF